MASEIFVGVGVVISSDRTRILACQRRLTDYWGGWWEFPGGKCEADETIQQCVTRELLEEVGVRARPIEPLAAFDHYYADRDRLVHIHPWLCELDGDSTPRAQEVECFRWCTPHELLALRFLPANEALIRSLIQRFSQSTP